MNTTARTCRKVAELSRCAVEHTGSRKCRGFQVPGTRTRGTPHSRHASEAASAMSVTDASTRYGNWFARS